MKEIQQIISDYVSDRPVMFSHNSDNAKMLTLILSEVAELSDVLDNNPELGHELSDVVWFCYSMAMINGIDLDEEIRTKAARNHLKRPAKDWQEGDYKEADQKARKEWKEQGGDEEFYKV